jgi:VWFA-related protein
VRSNGSTFLTYTRYRQPDTPVKRKGRPVRSRILGFVALALAAGTIAIAQSGASQQQEQQPQVFRTQANFVRVDAYPTRNGQPVLDLKAEEFEVFEDDKPQKVETFEHILISPAGPQSQRSEPSSIGASQQLIADPRNRVFVLFLDSPHVTVGGSWHAREPLIRFVDRLLGPDDLVGIMTPGMSAADVTFARKTIAMADGLRSAWPWGTRQTLIEDDRDRDYDMCYPMPYQRDVVAEMKARRHERNTLDALREIVLYLRDMREERKAIVTVSEGWLLFRPNADLTRLRKDPTDPTGTSQEHPPGPTPISVGPDGRITTKNPNVVGANIDQQKCDAERNYLSNIDDDQYFRDIIGDANRANATFYTIDPRGLPVFDTSIEQGATLVGDARMLRNRLDSLHTLADATDGMAVQNSNDLDAGLKRIANDLSSYYLLGYLSSNSKLDGKYHTIKVRVKRPGVDVRARRGYRSATAEEVTAARKAANPPTTSAKDAVTTAMAGLSRLRPDWRFSMNAVPMAAAGSTQISTILIAGEVPAGEAGRAWTNGGTIALDIRAGNATATARVPLAAGERSFVVPVKLSSPVSSGDLDVRASLTSSDPSAAPFTDILRLDLATNLGQPMLFRRGPTSGNRLVPAGSFQFSRTERAHLEFPAAADVKPGTARLLDKSGEPLSIPVTTSERTDAQTGQRWLTADVTLAALGAGDYVIEFTTGDATAQKKVLTAIRVTR